MICLYVSLVQFSCQHEVNRELVTNYCYTLIYYISQFTYRKGVGLIMDKIVEIILAIIGSGVLGTIVTYFVSKKKYAAEVDSLRQQIETARTDDKIKIDEHIQSQFMEIAESYKNETLKIKQELEEARRQNAELIKELQVCQQQIGNMDTRLNQLMGWVAYDMLHYQKWIEKELLKAKPEIEFPEYRKPPKFVQEYLNNSSSNDNTTKV